METKSSLESAFFSPRALIGLGFGAIGLLLGLVAFIALPTPSALASPSHCTDVVYTEEGGSIPDAIYVAMDSHSVGYPNSLCTIYYTIGATNPPNPTHSSQIYTNPIPVVYGQIRYFKAFGHKTYAQPEDSANTSFMVDNTGN